MSFKCPIEKYTDELEIDGSITIDNIKNLKIESFNELPYHLIFSGPDNEIKITNSENIRFTNLRIGHAEQDNGCPSGIFNIADSTNLIITNCILYGCGGNGLVARNSSYVQVSDTDIIGCVKEAVKLHSVRNSSFKNCRFLYNGAKAFSLFKCDMVRFDGLYAKGNGKYINESTSDYLFEFTACKDILLANAVMKENMVKQIYNVMPYRNNLIFKSNAYGEDYYIGDFENLPILDERGHEFNSGILLGTSYPYKTYWIAPEGNSLKVYYQGDFIITPYGDYFWKLDETATTTIFPT